MGKVIKKANVTSVVRRFHLKFLLISIINKQMLKRKRIGKQRNVNKTCLQKEERLR